MRDSDLLQGLMDMVNKLTSLSRFVKEIMMAITATIAAVTAISGALRLRSGDRSSLTVVLFILGATLLWSMGLALLLRRKSALPFIDLRGAPIGRTWYLGPRIRGLLIVGLVVIPVLVAFSAGCFFFSPQHDPKTVRILVAAFDGPDADSYRISDILVENLRALSKKYPDIVVATLDTPITPSQGSEVAIARGREHQAAVVLWGWYAKTQDAVQVTSHFELLEAPRRLRLNEDSAVLTAPLRELNSFKLQSGLSDSLRYVALVAVGLAHYESGDDQGAIDRLSEALMITRGQSQFINRDTVYFYRAKSYYFTSDMNHALEDLTAAIHVNPDFLDAYWLRALVHSETKRWDQAVEDYTRILERTPNDTDAVVSRGRMYLNKFQFELALRDFSRAIDLDPQDGMLNFVRGRAYDFQAARDQPSEAAGKDYLVAVEKITKAIEGSPHDHVLYLNRGEVNARIGDDLAALSDFSKAVILMPRDAEVYYWRGKQHAHMENHGAAIKDLSKAIALRPDMSAAFLARAGVYQEMDQEPKAKADYEEVIRLDNDQGDVYVARILLSAMMFREYGIK